MNDARPIAGLLWMLVSGVLFVAVNAVVKHLGGAIPAPELAFLRYAFGLGLILPFLGPILRDPPAGSLVRLFAVRGFAHAVGVALWFSAMAQIPLAEVTALNYLSPIYISVGAALFLGERLSFVRLAAIAGALVGVFMILRPGFRAVEPGHVAMLAAAVFFSASALIGKRTTALASPATVVAMLTIFVTIGLAPAAVAVWVTPTPVQMAWLFLVAVVATTGHYTMTLAFRAAPVSLTQPVTFLQLVWAALLGWALFGEGLDPYVLLGGGIIVASVSAAALREAVLSRRRRADPAAPPAAPAPPAA